MWKYLVFLFVGMVGIEGLSSCSEMSNKEPAEFKKVNFTFNQYIDRQRRGEMDADDAAALAIMRARMEPKASALEAGDRLGGAYDSSRCTNMRSEDIVSRDDLQCTLCRDGFHVQGICAAGRRVKP